MVLAEEIYWLEWQGENLMSTTKKTKNYVFQIKDR